MSAEARFDGLNACNCIIDQPFAPRKTRLDFLRAPPSFRLVSLPE